LFGAVTVVTGPTVIVPLLRTVRPTAHLANILRWEGIVIDPLGALLAVLGLARGAGI
jgi:NhaP-type Na+/H+ or K+/H+ antiporter